MGGSTNARCQVTPTELLVEWSFAGALDHQPSCVCVCVCVLCLAIPEPALFYGFFVHPEWDRKGGEGGVRAGLCCNI